MLAHFCVKLTKIGEMPSTWPAYHVGASASTQPIALMSHNEITISNGFKSDVCAWWFANGFASYGWAN
jgi:hypothetical protein